MAEQKEMLFGVVSPPEGIIIRCKKCGQIVAHGAAMIEVQVKDDKGAYSLGSEKKIFCCNEEKKVPELFGSADEAEQMIKTIERGLQEDGAMAVSLHQLGTIQKDGSAAPVQRPQ